MWDKVVSTFYIYIDTVLREIIRVLMWEETFSMFLKRGETKCMVGTFYI